MLTQHYLSSDDLDCTNLEQVKQIIRYQLEQQGIEYTRFKFSIDVLIYTKDSGENLGWEMSYDESTE